MKFHRIPILIFLFMLLCSGIKLSAQSQMIIAKFLEIRLEDEADSRILIPDNGSVKISIENNCLRFKTDESEDFINIDKITGMGIIEDEVLSANMIDYFNSADNKNWHIFNSSGVMIDSGSSSSPDISSLPEGQIYIIKTNTGTIKIIK